MKNKKYKYIYGPVFSWRLGRSLGIDIINNPRGKICSFDCVYCQIPETFYLSKRRKVFVPTEKVLEEIKSLPPLKIEYITFSGTGEPALAKNLGQLIMAVKKLREEKVAVLTNSSLIYRKDVQKDLLPADFVAAKLDAPSRKLLAKINRPVKGIDFNKIVNGLREFRSKYEGKLALQIMFCEENEDSAEKLAKIAREINPDEVQINTPLRPCFIKPLSKARIKKIKKEFKELNVIDVYSTRKKRARPLSRKNTLRRRGEAG